MKSMFISKKMYSKEVPEKLRPKMFDSASCLLVPIRYENQEGIVVYNFFKEEKIWYPFFDNENKYNEIAELDEYKLTYEKMIESFNSGYHIKYQVIQNADLSKRMDDVKRKFLDLHELNACEIENLNIEPIYELRFSKASNTWTFYKFEFFLLKSVDDPKRLLLNKYFEQAIMPLRPKPKFQKMAVVPNLVELLKSKEVREVLKENIINIE